jgi:hypothetical protein
MQQPNKLASSNSETPAVESVRPGGVLTRAQVANICMQITPRLVMVTSTAFIGIAQQAMDDKAQGKPPDALQAGTEFAGVMSKLIGDTLFEYLEPLLVGRSTPHEATMPTEAKP